MKHEFESNDRLAARLRSDAQLTRPSFSPDLHARTLQRIRNNVESSRSRWLPLLTSAAAILLLALTIFAWRFRAHHLPTQATVVHLPGLPSEPVIASNTGSTVPILSATLFPPRITVSLDNSTEPGLSLSDRPSSPEQISNDWLFDNLQIPSTSARDVLSDLIPPEVHDFQTIWR